jgi:uncharacterized protein (UPF0218 family)
MDKDLKIPYELRYRFAEPLDLLIAGTRENTIKEVENNFREKLESSIKFEFYLVGDIVTKDFLANSFLKSHVKLCIIDEKTKREQIKIRNEGEFEEIIEIENPAGIISKESWFILKKIIESKKITLLKITEGEEDLLVLPLVLELPSDGDVKNYAFYGQPPITDAKVSIPQGIVVIEVNETTKKKVKELIDIMEEI